MEPLFYAINEVGIVEATGNNDGIPSERYMGGRHERWCAHFGAWCFRQAGMPLPGDRQPHPGSGGENPIASVAEMERSLSAAGRGRRPGYAARPSDIVFFADRGGSDGGTGRHVGLIEAVTDGDTGMLLHTIEGNLANCVRRAVHRADDPRIVGYGLR